MYRSVGKLPVSVRIIFRSGRSCSAAASSLNKFTDVESATTGTVRCGANQLSDLRADAQRQADPVMLCPGADQRLAPFSRHHLRNPRGCCLRQRAQRVAVQVDYALRQLEPVSEWRQRIGRIQRGQIVARQRSHSIVLLQHHAGRRPAIHHQCLTGDEASGGRCQEHGGAGDFVRLADALQRHVACCLAVAHRVGP